MKDAIKIYTKIQDWTWYKNPYTSKLFLHLLLTACEDNCVQDGVPVERGQVCMSLRQMSEECGVSVSQCRTAIKNLCHTGEIEVNTDHKKFVITIINYDTYQGKEKPKMRVNNLYDVDNQTWYKSVINDRAYLEQACMKLFITIEQYKEVLQVFTDEADVKDTKHRTRNHYLEHFINWLRYNKIEDVLKKKTARTYTYQWDGMPLKKGTKSEYERDKRNYDHPGFNFKLISAK